MICNVCKNRVDKILNLTQSQQVTSLGRLVSGQAAVYRCDFCSHCQTESTINLAEYYANDYKTLMHTMEEDDIYKIVNDQVIWRAEHMARTFIEKIDKLLTPSSCNNTMSFLDFGTGKGLFPKMVVKFNHSLEPYLFDISEDYTPSWDLFCNSSHYSCFTVPVNWHHSFDIISSMFSLEHVMNPLTELQTISNLLKPGGILYITVPNMYSENIFDMVVVDHVQHYSPYSISALLEQVDLILIDADHDAHDQASIYVAQKRSNAKTKDFNNSDMMSYLEKQEGISLYFGDMVDKISKFAESAQGGSIVVVGAGVIGTFVKSILDGRFRIDLFVDSNIHKQFKGWLSIPVISPSALAEYDNLNRPHYIIAHNSKMRPLGLAMLPQNIAKDRILTLF